MTKRRRARKQKLDSQLVFDLFLQVCLFFLVAFIGFLYLVPHQ
ncbi:MAG TPA: hypothetical protein VF828_01720 [Patescibacteria group bacterium]